MKIAFFGAEGKAGSAVVARLQAAGHEVRGIELGDEPDVAGCDAAVDFTTPEAAPANVRAALEQGVSCVVGTTGWEPAELGALAAERGLRLFVAPNFSIGAVLMMRFAGEAAAHFPRAEIVELHNEAKKDAPSGTAKATADLPAVKDLFTTDDIGGWDQLLSDTVFGPNGAFTQALKAAKG